MNKKLFTITLALIVAIMMVGTVKATPTLWIQIKDSGGNDIANTTVPVSTIAYVYAHYEDASGSDATVSLTVFYDDGLGPQLVATLFSGTVKNGTTVAEKYTLTNVGTYEFRWTCALVSSEAVSGFSSANGCPPSYQQRGQISTFFENKVPEPLPVAGLAIGLLAFGLFASTRKRAKPAEIL